jgi:hypothetical protein
MVMLSPPALLESHAAVTATGSDRSFESVVPEISGVEIDTERLFATVEPFINGEFSNPYGRPNDHVSRAGFTFHDGVVEIKGNKRALRQNEESLAETIGNIVLPIDTYYRELAQIPAETPLVPTVTLLAGRFSGRNPSDTNRHLDYKGTRPIITFKTYFRGDPEHSSVYYPGAYRLPSRGWVLACGLAGFDGRASSPSFPRHEQQRHIMPQGVCIEPWNAVHSGPTDKGARGARRALLTVSYDLSRTV